MGGGSGDVATDAFTGPGRSRLADQRRASLLAAQVLRYVGNGAAGGADFSDRAREVLPAIHGVLPQCWWLSIARTVALASGTPRSQYSSRRGLRFQGGELRARAVGIA